MEEMNNTNVVSTIESKFPKYLALNCDMFIHTLNCDMFIHSNDSKVEKSNKFPDLLNYLITKRNVLEYGMSDLRISVEKNYGTINYVELDSDSKCLIHNDDTRKTSECRAYVKLTGNSRYEFLRQKSACFSCLLPNHFMFECKNKRKCIHGCDEFHHETYPSIVKK